MRAWTFAYFVPLALQFETAGQLSPAMIEEARRWVSLSLLRLPFVVGAAVALWMGARRLDRPTPRDRREEAGGAGADRATTGAHQLERVQNTQLAGRPMQTGGVPAL